MTQEKHIDVTIIGAGLTGLSLASFLTSAGKTVRIIEKQNRCGGVINSISENGFTFETGPNTGLASNNAVDKLFKNLEGQCTVEGARPESKARWIWKKDRWHNLPSGPISGIRTPLFSTRDKFRILGEPFRKAGNDPNESVASMVKRRMGTSFLNYAVDPFISGVYAGDPNYLVTKYALQKLYRLEQTYGSFIKGSIKRGKELKQERLQRKYNGIFSFEGGMVKLIKALEQQFGTDAVLLNANNTIINPTEDGYKVTTTFNNKPVQWCSKHIVFTTGTTEFNSMLPFIDANYFDAINKLEYAKVIQVAIGYKKWNGTPINAYGGLIPSIEKRKALGILFPSSIFNNRAPKQGAMLSVFLGGFRKPEMLDLSETEIEKIVLHEIEETLQLSNTKPDLLRIFKYHKAIPQYGLGSDQRITDIASIENKYIGLYLAGNIRDGIGMADRINQAYELAQQITKRGVN